jgi:23S rRNA pseudouridine2605 synthase
MRDRPHPNHKLEWPGGVVPEWAKPQQNFKRRGGKGAKGERNGGSSPGKRERLQKVMAQSGHGSRRNIEILIAQGHITINGQLAKLGDSVGPGDKVKLDGHLLRLRFGEPLPRVLLYHKPEGEIVTRDDPEGRATVFEKLPKVTGGRWVSVGRLDLNTGGLLIFTTSGELANRLTHPRFEVEREYAVRVLGEIDEEKAKQLLAGVEIEGESCKFDSIEDRGGEGSNHWYHVVLREGKNREVRKMCEAVGLTVSRLMRVRFGEVALPGFLKRGMMREMAEEEIQSLLAFSGMNEPPPGEDGEAPVEDEHDNIGNRVPDAGRRGAPRELDESRDNIGNRADSGRAQRAHFDDDIGNRVDSAARARAEAVDRDIGNRAPAPRDGIRDDVGNRPEPGNRAGAGHRGEPGNRPPKPGQRRAPGAKPFFGKKRGQGQGQGQGQGGQGHGGQGHGQGNRQPHAHGAGGPAQGQGQGQGQHRQQRRKPNPNAAQGQAAHGEAHAPRPQAGPPAPGQNAGAAKPGRNRRNKNRNRNRGAEGRSDAPPAVPKGGGE